MGLKQLIKEQRILASGAVDAELTLPGEPCIYSIKFNVGKRTHSIQFFRNMQWRSLLKCFFRSYHNTSTPVVLIVKFFVSPPEHIRIKASDLKRENTPATFGFELCEYVLSFLEMLHHVLFNSYRQVVRMETEKWYSNNPRIVFKFMSYDHYAKLHPENSLHSNRKRLLADGQIRDIQPKRKKHESHPKESPGNAAP